MSDISYYGVEPTAARETETRVSQTTVDGQTVIPATYSVGFVSVFYNGVKLNPTEYTATDGSNIVLPVGAPAGTKIDVVAHRQVVTYPGNIEATPIGQANPAPGTFSALNATVTSVVPLRSQFDNTTNSATTSFVNRVGVQYSSVKVVTASSTTIDASYAGALTVFAAPLTGAVSFSLPLASTIARAGSCLSFVNYSASAVITLNRNGSDYFRASSVNTTSITLRPNDTVTLTSNGSNGWEISDGSAQEKTTTSCFRATTPNTGGSAQSITAGVNTKLSFSVIGFDDLGEFNTSTSTFTPTYSGIYEFTGGMHGSGGTSSGRLLWVAVNGVETVRLYETGFTSAVEIQYFMGGSTGPISLNAGDAVTLYFRSNSSASLNALSAVSYFAGKRVK